MITTKEDVMGTDDVKPKGVPRTKYAFYAYVEEWMEQYFEKFAEDWWANRALQGRWLEEQALVEDMWEMVARDGVKKTLGMTINCQWPKSREERTYVWAESLLRESPCWMRVYDESR